MATMGSWNGFQFVVSPSLVRSFSELTITGGSETEDKVSEKQKYVERLNSTATEISLSVYLNAHLGCNVRSEADGLISAANAGACSYFYVGGKKLVPYKLMLTQAQASEIEISPGGTWIACKVSLTLKQGEKDSGGMSGSGSQGGKMTVRQESFLQQTAGAITSTVTQIQQTASQIVASIASKINGATQDSTPAVSAPGSLLQQACEQVSRITAAAQSASKTAASSNPTSSTGMGGRKPITAIDIK